MNNINSNFDLNYRPAFKSSKNGEKQMLASRFEQKFDRNFSGHSETQKRTIRGVLLATIVCGMMALNDMLISGTIKAIGGRIKFSDILNPKKSMSKTGKWATAIVGTFIITKNLIKGILIDKKTNTRH